VAFLREVADAEQSQPAEDEQGDENVLLLSAAARPDIGTSVCHAIAWSGQGYDNLQWVKATAPAGGESINSQITSFAVQRGRALVTMRTKLAGNTAFAEAVLLEPVIGALDRTLDMIGGAREVVG
jgi:hypothetical protein